VEVTVEGHGERADERGGARRGIQTIDVVAGGEAVELAVRRTPVEAHEACGEAGRLNGAGCFGMVGVEENEPAVLGRAYEGRARTGVGGRGDREQREDDDVPKAGHGSTGNGLCGRCTRGAIRTAVRPHFLLTSCDRQAQAPAAIDELGCRPRHDLTGR
jgi:hypothetical protein